MLFKSLLPTISLLALGSRAADGTCTNTKPKNFICGGAGTLSSKAVISSDSTQATDLNTCRDACLVKAACKSFGFQQGAVCELYSKKPVAMGYKKGRTSTVQYYHRKCFGGSGCPKPSTAPVPFDSLITAGDFEDGSGTWGSWAPATDYGSAISVVSPGYNSDHAGQISLSSDYNGIYQKYMGIPVTAGQPYTIGFDLNMLDPECAASVGLIADDGFNTLGSPLTIGKQYDGSFATPAVQGYAHYEQVVVPFGSTYNFGLYSNCAGKDGDALAPTMDYDNIQFKKSGSTVYSASSPATGGNVISNGNFESGDLGPWTPIAISSATVTYDNSQHAVAIAIDPPTGSQGNGGISQDIQTSKGKIYLASVDYMYTGDLGDITDFYGAQCLAWFQLGNDYQRMFFDNFVSYPTNPGNGAGQWSTTQGIIAGLTDAGTFQAVASCTKMSNTFYFRNLKLIPLS